MKVRIINKKLIWGIGLLVIVAAVIVIIRPVSDGLISSVLKLTGTDVILIDPGHGGIDGGASSDSGVIEKEVNLSIAFYIKELAEADGWKVVMTREEDIGLGDREDRTIRSRKTADLIARREIIKEIKPTLAVSIHLNSFKQDRSVRGAQTFYPSGPGEEAVLEECKMLAKTIQEQLTAGIGDGSDRAALAKRDVLMFKNPTVPMVLIECGFLSNPEEAELLGQEEYQRKLAKCIYKGIMLYTGKEPKEPIRFIDSRG